MPAEAIPYETLVRFGVAHQRLNEVWCELAKLDEELGHWITDRLGVLEVSPVYSDQVCEEFLAAVHARYEEALGDA